MGTHFAATGYDTAYFGKWHLNFDKTNHEHHGFAMTGVLKDTGHDPQIASAAARYLRSRKDSPFLVVVSFCDPHDICQWTDGRVLPGGALPAPPVEDELPPAPANVAPSRNEGDILRKLREAYQQVHVAQDVDTAEGTRRCRELTWAYHRLIERVDAHIGTVLQALSESGHEDDTVVVYASDHGEMLGAHGLVQKSFFYEEAVHVPFLVRDPNSRAATCDQIVNASVDLLPTLLDCAGIPVPGSLPGRSVWPMVQGNPTLESRDDAIGQVHLCHPRMPSETPHTYGRMVRSAGYSYWLLDQGQQRELLFDTEMDPGETMNVAGASRVRDVLLGHRAFLRRHVERTGDAQAARMLETTDQMK
jgi:choline-sulfatase